MSTQSATIPGLKEGDHKVKISGRKVTLRAVVDTAGNTIHAYLPSTGKVFGPLEVVNVIVEETGKVNPAA